MYDAPFVRIEDASAYSRRLPDATYAKLRGNPNLGAYVRERPRCRAAILRLGLKPWRGAEGYWAGWSAEVAHETCPGKVQRAALSDGMAKQMRRMLWERRWPAQGEPSQR